MAYVDQYATARDESFLQKIRMAVLEAAVDIMNESTGTAGHDLRAGFAREVLAYPDQRVGPIAEAVCAKNPAIAVGSADATIKTAVASVWSALAGYSANA